MFSTQQLDMMNAVLNSHSDEILAGNFYYVAYTTNTTDNDADLIIAMSTDPISTSDGYNYRFEADAYSLVSCYTSNYYSGNFHSGKRIQFNTVNSKNLAVDYREFVSTNVKTETYLTYDFHDRGLIYNAATYKACSSVTFILGVVLIFSCLSHFFDLLRRRR